VTKCSAAQPCEHLQVQRIAPVDEPCLCLDCGAMLNIISRFTKPG
jgi:hypothetical protein